MIYLKKKIQFIVILFSLCLFLYNCGFKPKVSCDLSLKKSILEIKDKCIETPQMAITKEF